MSYASLYLSSEPNLQAERDPIFQKAIDAVIKTCCRRQHGVGDTRYVRVNYIPKLMRCDFFTSCIKMTKLDGCYSYVSICVYDNDPQHVYVNISTHERVEYKECIVFALLDASENDDDYKEYESITAALMTEAEWNTLLESAVYESDLLLARVARNA